MNDDIAQDRKPETTQVELPGEPRGVFIIGGGDRAHGLFAPMTADQWALFESSVDPETRDRIGLSRDRGLALCICRLAGEVEGRRPRDVPESIADSCPAEPIGILGATLVETGDALRGSDFDGGFIVPEEFAADLRSAGLLRSPGSVRQRQAKARNSRRKRRRGFR